ncbi:MAG: prepilin-type N-terminal cleavage/methylation domain-containing protein [Cyanobacteria bacterium J06581_3]
MKLVKNNQTIQKSTEAGLTLIECLVALSVIALSVATIAPMMVFSVATRVQNQKTEQALQLAQSEIDKVRLTVEQGGDYGERLTELSLFSTDASTSLATVPAPTEIIASTASIDKLTQARPVDLDGDGDMDFAIQLFRDRGIEVAASTASIASTPVSFNIGVRVYDSRAQNNQGSLLVEPAGLVFTSGEGQRGRRPLAVLYSQITQGDRVGSLCQYWELAGSTPTSMQCE